MAGDEKSDHSARGACHFRRLNRFFLRAIASMAQAEWHQ
jgi:hypothetical protein